MTTPEERLGERIRVARNARGLSQAELAEMTGSNQRVISKVEAGKTDMRLSTLRRIAAALNVTIDWLTREQPVDVELFGSAEKARPPQSAFSLNEERAGYAAKKLKSPGARAKRQRSA